MAFKDPRRPIIATKFATDTPPNKRIEISSTPANAIQFFSGEAYETLPGELQVDSNPGAGSAFVQLFPPEVSPGPAISANFALTNAADGKAYAVLQANNIQFNTSDGHLATYENGTLLTEEVVTQATLLGTWATLGGGWPHPRYYKDIQGFINLVGGVTGGAAGQTIFTLPAGYRPPYTIPIEAEGNLARARLTVRTNGNVVLDVGSGTNLVWANVRFPTSAVMP